MADAVAGTAVQYLLENLFSMLSGEIKLVRGFEKNLTKLQKELSKTQEKLSDAEEKEIKDKAVNKWLKDLEDLAFEADAVLDEFSYHLLQKKLKNRTKKVSSSSSSGSISFLLRRTLARKINNLNIKFEDLNNKADSQGLEKTVVTAPDASTVGLLDQETNSYSIEPNFVGRENDMAEIVERVINAPLDEKISVIPIVGMGGLGKTALTRKICHHEKIESCFQKRIWIYVSHKFDELTILRKIHKTLTEEVVQFNEPKEVVLQKIDKVLKSEKIERYLMILDDVWNEDSKKWEDFMKSMLGIGNATQNVIIVTTRLEPVASLVKTLSLYKLRGLSDDDCWSIIKAKATANEKALSSNGGLLEYYEEIGKQFAQKCGGLPLAAHMIGGLLRKEPKEEWSSILMNELPSFQRDDDNRVMKILQLSYKRLPSSLFKKCFAYCSVFPQDSDIKKETLIEQWMGEGFLQINQENVNLETIGNTVFNYLLQVSLFQEYTRDDLGNITHCRMHDYVHDLARLVSGGRSSILKDNGNDMTKVRYLYLQSGRISTERAKYLRTLIFDGEVADMFPGYCRLRVVTVTNPSIQELPTEIEKQIHMRFLDMSRTNIKRLPDSINKLSNLQTLVATNLKSLPNTIIDLLNLRHLHISSIELPPFIGKLTSLRTLPYYKVGHDSGRRISELENLKNLKGVLEIQNLERVKDKREAEHADLFGKSNISTLNLVWGNTSVGDRNDENVLEGLQPHPNLKSLKICGYESNNFPSWTRKMTVYSAVKGRSVVLSNLVEICIDACKNEKIPNLGHLPCLKFLELKHLPAVQSIDLSFYGLEDCSTSTVIDNVNKVVFPALQKLCLLAMPELTVWTDVESRIAMFPCLEYLKIEQCPRLESAPTRFPCLKELRIEKIGSNVCLTNICKNTSSLQILDVKKYSGIMSLGDECFVKNRDLSHLEINDCPNISSVLQQEDSSNIHCLPSLKYFHIDNCEGLKTIPDWDFSSLQKLYISDCSELKSIPNVELRSLRILYVFNCPALACFPLESCTSSLENLTLRDLPNVENMDVVMSCISRMSRLESLSLIGLPKLTSSLAVFCQFSKLWNLGYSGFSDDDLKRILHGTHRLRCLSIIGNEDLPDHIQHLHALQELWIHECGIETLPEWIEDLSSLRFLWIKNCKRLTHLPSRKGMQHITNLQIYECPLLADKLRTPADENSERAKILHIEYVEIDWVRLPTGNFLAQEENKYACCFPIPKSRKRCIPCF